MKALGVTILVLWVVSANGIDPSQCAMPLGMESGTIRDEDIVASSSFDHNNVGPHHGRVRTELNGGAWCPQSPATNDPEEWLEINLHTVHLITHTGTQGRFGNGQGVEYAETYLLEYWRPRMSKWVRYRNHKGEEILKGNINTYLEAKTQLDPSIWASKVRFIPYSHHKRTVCMRVELYGCKWTDGIVSYSMPQGDKRGSGWEFYDITYDGHWDGDWLRQGLGQLTDGHVGPDDFKFQFYDYSYGWVGWKNDTRPNKPIEINFEFDKVREFNTVHIYCNNQFAKEVQVFAKVEVYFSVGGKRYKGEPITFDYIEDHIFESARNVSVKLHHRVGRFVKLRMHFANRWMLISEINFESTVVNGNITQEEEDSDETLLQKDQFPVGDNKNVISAVNSSPGMGQYLGVIVGLLSVLAVLMIAAVAFIIIQQRRCKSSPRPSQTKSGCDKVALYREPSLVRLPRNSDYSDVQNPEYAVPLQASQSSSQNFLPKPPTIPPPLERYYAATEICNTSFVPPPPPLSTPPLGKLNRQPRYVSNIKTYIGP